MGLKKSEGPISVLTQREGDPIREHRLYQAPFPIRAPRGAGGAVRHAAWPGRSDPAASSLRATVARSAARSWHGEPRAIRGKGPFEKPRAPRTLTKPGERLEYRRAYAAQAESLVPTAPAEGSLAPTKGCRGAAEGVTSARWTRAGHDAAPVREHGF